jgi:hypothetical protein
MDEAGLVGGVPRSPAVRPSPKLLGELRTLFAEAGVPVKRPV